MHRMKISSFFHHIKQVEKKMNPNQNLSEQVYEPSLHESETIQDIRNDDVETKPESMFSCYTILYSLLHTSSYFTIQKEKASKTKAKAKAK